ncbi:MAG: alcohol dehydrogenase catalytic domain-containing protein [Phycisphaerales bacterium]|nr:alcohol dehydrogenase catalytic domain-containing protein [Phycisphaerales bacterium]
MRALTFDGSNVRLARDHPEPSLQPGWALVRPTLLAIDATDLALVKGQIPHRGVIGHLFVGIVEQVRPDSAGGEHIRGRRVVAAINIVPHDSELARRGLGNHAHERRILGLRHMDGCFADHFAIPLHNLIPVPETISDEQAVLTEPLAAALHASRITRIEGKPYVTILGDDPVALLSAQLMTRLNASVRVLGASPTSLALCEKWQIKHRPVDEAGLRQDQDIVIECTGHPASVARAMHMVRPRGRIVLRSPVLPTPDAEPTGPGPNLTPVILNEIELLGARCGNMSEALSVLSRQPIDLVSLITRRFRFDDALEALRAASEPGAMFVVMES